MKNLKGTVIWCLVLFVWILIIIVPQTKEIFIKVTELHPYVGGFIKFSILATLGDLLGVRILKGQWILPKGLVFKAIIWGILGMIITLVFTVYTVGVIGAQSVGKLPFGDSNIATAIFASVIMNATFGPMMYIYHKFADMYVDMILEKKSGELTDAITVKTMVDRVDWYNLVSFSWLKTCIFVWMPCHSIVFLISPQYQVLASAFLSILLGVLVAISKKNKNTK